MSRPAPAVPLGEVAPARSRQRGRRSAVALAGETAVVGTADGALVGVDVGGDRPTERWRREPAVEAGDGDAPGVVAATPFDGGVVAGERSARGAVRCHAADGTLRWRHDAREAVGAPAKETRFWLPFVASVAADDDRVYAAARRYERVDDDRTFESAVFAVDPDGTVAWTYRTDASPVAVDCRGDRVAVAYNRCPGDHQHGLVVLDADDGSPRWMWDPGTEGQRRVGDVSLVDGGAVLASHGDYCGYRLGPGGTRRWRHPLGTPRDVAGETVYAYPNHVHATEEGVAFVTGNTYPESGRETDARHPREHTAVGVALDGTERWTASVGGFASGLGVDDGTVAVPGAQHFRDRDADAHALRLFDVREGAVGAVDADGVVTAAAVAGGRAVAVEEPVVYHDEGERRGAYRLHAVDVPD